MKCPRYAIAAVAFIPTAFVFSQESATKSSPPANSQAQRSTTPDSGVALGKPLVWEPPIYPKHALEQKLQGSVILKLTVAKDGSIKKAEAVRGDPELAESAVRSARRWRCVPHYVGEKPVETQSIVSFNFKISEAGQPDVSVTYKAPPDPPTSEIAKPGPGISAPKAIYAPDPDYSAEAQQAKYEGVCVLALIVGADGYPRDIKVSRTLGKGLDEKAIEAVQRWRFLPARKNGVPVAVVINVEVQFRL